MPGAFHVLTAWPIADASVQWTPTAAPNVSNLVDKPSNDGLATVVTAATGGLTDLYQLETIPDGTITAIQGNAYVQGAGAEAFAHCVRIGGVTYEGTPRTLLASTLRDLRQVWPVAPDDGLPWTAAKVNAARWGFRRVASPDVVPVQVASGRNPSAALSYSLAFPANVTAGNVLVVSAGCFYLKDLGPAPTDSQGNTYVLRDTSAIKNGTWTAIASASGPCTVTMTLHATSSAGAMALGLAELPAGTYTFTPSLTTGGSGVTVTNTITVPPTPAALLLCFATCQGDPAGTFTVDGAWTEMGKNAGYSGFGTVLPYNWVRRAVSSGGTYSVTFTVGANITLYWSLIAVCR
jgi:hypothetical protein